MGLIAGTRLGPYEIVSPIGAGGMGEVYRARDPRLNRLIAIKLLPASAAADAERRERFEREAQAIAALNHPSIVTIYSVEQADGQFFLTMELVEGHALTEAIPKGGLALDRVLRICIPVVEAIAAAHQKGITHRDLKPANIMIVVHLRTTGRPRRRARLLRSIEDVVCPGIRGAHTEVRGDPFGHRVGDRRDVGHRLIKPAAPRNGPILRANETHGQLEPVAGPEKKAVDDRVHAQRPPDDRRIFPAVL